MGASTISIHHKAPQNLSEAWEEIYTNARHEHGSDPYSGSFATCSGVIQVADLMGIGEAEAVAEAIFLEGIVPARIRHKMRQNVSSADGRVLKAPVKWGQAFAIPVYDTAGTKSRRKELVINHEVQGYLGISVLDELVQRKLELKEGSWLARLDVVEDTVRSRKTVERGVGKATTNWVLVGEDGRRVEDRTEYATERDAVNAAEEHLKKKLAHGWWRTGERVRVEAIRRRGGVPTYVGVELKSRRTKISFEIETVGSKTHGGWYFFGWAAS